MKNKYMGLLFLSPSDTTNIHASHALEDILEVYFSFAPECFDKVKILGNWNAVYLYLVQSCVMFDIMIGINARHTLTNRNGDEN